MLPALNRAPTVPPAAARLLVDTVLTLVSPIVVRRMADAAVPAANEPLRTGAVRGESTFVIPEFSFSDLTILRA
jgi:hypothetical protein